MRPQVGKNCVKDTKEEEVQYHTIVQFLEVTSSKGEYPISRRLSVQSFLGLDGSLPVIKRTVSIGLHVDTVSKSIVRAVSSCTRVKEVQ